MSKKRGAMTMNHNPPPPGDQGPKHASVTSVKRKLDHAGRVLVPAKFRKALTVEAGSEVMLVLNGGVLEVHSINNAILVAQALVRRHVPKDTSLVQELINERNREAASE